MGVLLQARLNVMTYQFNAATCADTCVTYPRLPPRALQLGAELFQQKLGKQCMQWLQVRACRPCVYACLNFPCCNQIAGLVSANATFAGAAVPPS